MGASLLFLLLFFFKKRKSEAKEIKETKSFMKKKKKIVTWVVWSLVHFILYFIFLIYLWYWVVFECFIMQASNFLRCVRTSMEAKNLPILVPDNRVVKVDIHATIRSWMGFILTQGLLLCQDVSVERYFFDLNLISFHFIFEHYLFDCCRLLFQYHSFFGICYMCFLSRGSNF